MTKLEEVMARLNPKTVEAFNKASSIERELLATPSLGLNMALGGGLRYGAIHTLWGPRSGGKTMFALGLAAEAQRNDKAVAWVDAEKNFDPVWAGRHGVDVDNIQVSHTATMTDTTNHAVDLVRNGIDLLIVDSMSVLLPQSYFDDGEMKPLEKTNQIGTFSKNYGSMVSMLNNLNKHTNIVMISQLRNKFNQWGASKGLMGGEAAEFMNSTIIKLWAPTNDKDALKGKVRLGDMILERPVGRKVTWTIDKARGSGMHQSNDYNMYFAGDHVGIDRNSEVTNFGLEYGIIEKSGNWLSYDSIKENGKDNFTDALRAAPEIAEKAYQELMEKVRV